VAGDAPHHGDNDSPAQQIGPCGQHRHHQHQHDVAHQHDGVPLQSEVLDDVLYKYPDFFHISVC
jgi:hypothetical protein